MDIRCERCRAEYRFKDDAIGPAGLTVRCSKCGHVFKVRRPAAPAAVAPAADAAWALRKKRTGDVYAVADLPQLQRWVAERRAIRDDEASLAGGPWRRLADIPELGAAFAVAQAAKRSAAGAGEATAADGARREVAHTTSVFPGPGRPPAPMRTEIAYRVPEGSGTDSAEPAWARAPAAADRGQGMAPMFGPAHDDRPRVGRDPAFAEPEPTLRVSGEPERGPHPFTGSAPLTVPEQAPLSALIDEGPPPTRTPPRPRKRSTVGTVIGTLAVLLTLVALGGVAVALLKPEWLDPLFAGLDLGSSTKPPAPAPATPVPGTGSETSTGPSEQAAPSGASHPSADRTRTPSTSVPGADGGTTAGAGDGGVPPGLNPSPATRAPLPVAQTPTGAPPATGSSAPPTTPPSTPGAASGETAVPGTPPPGTAPESATAAVPSREAPAPAGGGVPPARPSAEKPAPGAETGPEKPVPGTEAAASAAPAKQVPDTAPANPEGPAPGTAQKVPPAAAPPDQAPASVPAPAPAPETASAQEKAVAPAPPPPTAPAKPARPRLTGVAAQLAQARSLRERGRAEQALDLYGQILDKEPQNPDALAGRGHCYFDLGQTSEAEKAFKAALGADANNGDALLGLAETYRYGSRREDALAYYEKYLEAHPRGPGASIARANIQALKE